MERPRAPEARSRQSPTWGLWIIFFCEWGRVRVHVPRAAGTMQIGCRWLPRGVPAGCSFRVPSRSRKLRQCSARVLGGVLRDRRGFPANFSVLDRDDRHECRSGYVSSVDRTPKKGKLGMPVTSPSGRRRQIGKLLRSAIANEPSSRVNVKNYPDYWWRGFVFEQSRETAKSYYHRKPKFHLTHLKIEIVSRRRRTYFKWFMSRQM